MIEIEIRKKQVRYIRGFPPGLWLATKGTGGREFNIVLTREEEEQIDSVFKKEDVEYQGPSWAIARRSYTRYQLQDQDTLELLISLILVKNGIL